MANRHRELVDARRRTVMAHVLLWGNAHFDPKAGFAISAAGTADTIMNVRYAAALLDATAEGLEVQLSHSEARDRANDILKRLFIARKERGQALGIPRHNGSNARPLPVPIALDLLLGPLAYL